MEARSRFILEICYGVIKVEIGVLFVSFHKPAHTNTVYINIIFETVIIYEHYFIM